MLDEILYFADSTLSKPSMDDILSKKVSITLLLKRTSDNLTGNIDDVVLQLLYGNSRCPPGDENSPSQKLMQTVLSVDENNKEIEDILIGIWAPPNALTKATMLKVIFPNVSQPYRLQNYREVPLHVAVAYDAYKIKDVLELMEQYSGQVMNYGFFTSDIPGEGQLIAKTAEKFEARTAAVTYEEKMVLQLAKTSPECFLAFTELGPSYMSSDVDIGEKDCQYFFPHGYNIPEAVIAEIKRKPKKKGRFPKIRVQEVQEISEAPSLPTESQFSAPDTAHAEEFCEEIEDIVHDDEANGDQESEADDEEKIKENLLETNENTFESTDKATSPIQHTL